MPLAKPHTSLSQDRTYNPLASPSLTHSLTHSPYLLASFEWSSVGHRQKF